ncbi:MAG: hypothetical protein LBU76_09405 [Azoarcus sp.]|jgi:hypothetical protein|nr:hypothetical protein [Azoarcus sp.]
MSVQPHTWCSIPFSFIFAVTAFITPVAALADYTEIDRLQARCEREKESLFIKKNGTPSCKKVEKLLREKAYKDRGEKPPIDEEDEMYFMWNESVGRLCYYKKNGEIMSCF